MAAEIFSQANAKFVDENYDEAIQLYSDAIREDQSKADYFLNRSHAYFKKQLYDESLMDAAKAADIDASNPKAQLRMGIAFYNLENYTDAKKAFEKGSTMDASDTQFSTWLSKCAEKLETSTNETNSVKQDTATVQVATEEKERKAEQQKPITPAAVVKKKYDWYQTDTHVIVTVLLKGVQPDQLVTKIEERTLQVTVNDFHIDLTLAHRISPDQRTTKVMKTKIEIKLKKVDGIRWSALEGTVEEENKVKHFTPGGSAEDRVNKYPSSAHCTRDWNKIEAEVIKEEKDEKPEGDAALNKLFQQIYADGSDEVKKAMNKSFQESGGTCLSTNWQDIAKKKTEVKPPDGMEYKEYEN
ncbi:unnamed protein product [Owenia fusiformis]|uniref:Uncharacterized protein n=1 Tax=Owenia fusiformis TaxID=6347 RepID=A0A8J1TGW8_OWEFU|nr:unnamed protein product [Owenia fusiformis]